MKFMLILNYQINCIQVRNDGNKTNDSLKSIYSILSSQKKVQQKVYTRSRYLHLIQNPLISSLLSIFISKASICCWKEGFKILAVSNRCSIYVSIMVRKYSWFDIS